MRNFGSLLPVFLDNYFIEGLDQVAMEITSGEDERKTGRVSFRGQGIAETASDGSFSWGSFFIYSFLCPH